MIKRIRGALTASPTAFFIVIVFHNIVIKYIYGCAVAWFTF